MSYDHGGNCWNCGTALGPNDYGRQDSCPKCGRDVKACKGCEFYDPSSHNECRENQADRVLEKDKANFCDYFRPKAGIGSPGASSKSAALDAAEALFKKK
jgi:predicted RNA-binding Zn-ribbon protein involved in translation (DUF1610 family)